MCHLLCKPSGTKGSSYDVMCSSSYFSQLYKAVSPRISSPFHFIRNSRSRKIQELEGDRLQIFLLNSKVFLALVSLLLKVYPLFYFHISMDRAHSLFSFEQCRNVPWSLLCCYFCSLAVSPYLRRARFSFVYIMIS